MNWKRIIAWTAAIGVLLIVALVVSGYFALRSSSFHQYVLAKIVQQAEESTGGKVEIRNFDFRLSGLSADLYGLTIHGTEPSDQKPLLQVDKLTVGLKILSVIHHKINLNQLLIEHPVAHLLVDKTGRNNIPQPNAPKQKSSQTNVFDLAVGHVLLGNGEIYYDDRQSSIDADVYDLRTEVNFDSLATRYAGSISYHKGRVKYAGLPSLAHSLDARFDATPSGLNLSPLVLTVGSSRIALQANVTNYSNPRTDARYNILLHTQDFAEMITAAAPAGDVALSGKLHYENLPNQTVLRDVSLDGQIDSSALLISAPQGRVELRKLFGRYKLADGNLQARDVIMELLNGKFTANATVQHWDKSPSTKLRATLQGISIAAVKSSLRDPSIKSFPLSGNVDGSVEASWVGSVSNLRAQSELGIRAAIVNQGGGAQNVPLTGAVHVSYDGPKNLIAVQQSIVQTPSSSIVAQGNVSSRPKGESQLAVQAKTSNLHELATLASALQTAPKDQSPQPKPLNLSGSATLNATLQGSLQNPQIQGQLTAQNLSIEGTQISTLQLTTQANPSSVVVQNGSLVIPKQANKKQGQISFNANVGLQHWSYLPSNPLAVNASVKQVSIAQLQQIAHVQYPIVGDLSADLTLRGSQLNPEGGGNLEIINATVYDEPVHILKAQFQATNGTVTSSLNVSLSAGAATADLTFVPKTKAYKVQMDAPGIVLAKLQAVQAKNLQLTGTLTAIASGSGTVDNPQLTATVQIPQLQIQQNTISGIKAQLNVANQQADLSLATAVAQATLQANAKVNLTGDHYADVKIDTSRIPLQPLLAVYAPSVPDDFQGETELHATLKGPLKDKARMEAHLEIPTLTATYQQLKIGNSGPIRADYANSVLVLQPSEIKGTDTSLSFRGRVPVGAGNKGMELSATGSVNLRLVRMFDPDIKSSGLINLDVRTTANGGKPEVTGQIKIQNVSVITTTAPVGIDSLNGTLDLKNNQIQMTELKGQVGGGDISIGGAITYKPQLQFNMALQGKSLRLRYPDGVRSVLDSDLKLTGNLQEAAVNGRVLIDGLSFTSDFDLAKFMNQFTGANVPPSGSTFADNVNLNVAVQSAGDLSAAASTISIEGTVNLRLIGTAANPVVVGRTDLTSGDIFFMSQRYQLQRGIINFTNPNEIEPVVNISLTTTVEQYNLTLNITGPIDKLQTSYLSDPPLAPVDIINLIARGRTTEEASTSSFGADSILAAGVASQLGTGVQKLVGISSLQIDPLLGGNTANPSARIALQQRVTKNFVFTFSTDVAQPQSEMVQGDYQISKRWSVSAGRDEYGSITAEGRFHTSF
jgi:translocation and assembly module TamB